MLGTFVGILFLSAFLSGCYQSYPANRVAESIQEICHKEYGIENIRVKIEGKTAGVFLPIKKLFSPELEALYQGKGKPRPADIEKLFQPVPEALDQVEDVLFSISRVLLSTDLKLEFYTLQATDVETTGFQLVLTGYVDDIKRVRLWDISRDEYRKRVFHELRVNRAVISHSPVRLFFSELEKGTPLEQLQSYFAEPVAPELFAATFFLDPAALVTTQATWRLGELRSASLGGNRVVVYVPVAVEYDPTSAGSPAFFIPSGSTLEYFVILSFAEDTPKIVRVIPFSFLDEAGELKKIALPEEMDLNKDLELWETEFSVTEIDLGVFLAEQLTRRTQALLGSDERIQNTFEAPQALFQFHRKEEEENLFSLELDLKPRTAALWAPAVSLFQEDVLYLLNLVSREFVNVLRSYQFSDYHFLQLKLASDPTAHMLGREDLELFRRNKTSVQGLLSGVPPL